MSSDPAIERLQAAIVDGRTENTRYRQDQLQNLHRALRDEAGAICSALAKDSQASSAEVEAEYYLGMEAVRHFYESIDFVEERTNEHGVSHGKDHASRRLGAGLVVIRPTSHTRFYSIVSPLAAAISAGNAVLLELQDTLLQVDSVLRNTLDKTLDVSTFYISKTITDKSILESAVLVDQTTNAPSSTSTSQLLSSSAARTIAIVDRTADVDAAAKAITNARFGFGGTSPYAPDLVLVNEYVKKEFFEACSRYATLSFAKESGIKKFNGNRNEATRKAVQEAESKRQVSSFGSNEFKLVDILNNNAPILNLKISGRYLPIASCSGLVDAIFTREFETPLLAGYFFADPAAAKYLSQHLPCHISCINQIPPHLLVGPAAPLAHDPDFHYRYSKEMFSKARPQFVEASPEAFAKAEQLLEGSKRTSTQAIRKLATTPLGPTGQPNKDILGFFESGFLLSASITLITVLPLLGYTTYLLGRKGLQFASSLKH